MTDDIISEMVPENIELEKNNLNLHASKIELNLIYVSRGER